MDMTKLCRPELHFDSTTCSEVLIKPSKPENLVIPSFLEQPVDKLAAQFNSLREDDDLFYAGMALKNKSYVPLPVTRSLAEEEKALKFIRMQQEKSNRALSKA